MILPLIDYRLEIMIKCDNISFLLTSDFTKVLYRLLDRMLFIMQFNILHVTVSRYGLKMCFATNVLIP